jgi:hypothetical protein
LLLSDYPYKEPAEFGKRNASLLSAVDAALTPKDKIEFLKVDSTIRRDQETLSGIRKDQEFGSS